MQVIFEIANNLTLSFSLLIFYIILWRSCQQLRNKYYLKIHCLFSFLQTYISDVIIAINPYTTLSNYTQEVSPSTTEQFISVEINYNLSKYKILLKLLRYRSRCQDDIFPRIELIPSFVLSSDNTNCKNDIQLFHQLFDELSVHTDYH